MKILLTTPYCIVPANYGGAVRTTRLAEALGNAGHVVSVLGADTAPLGGYAFGSHGAASYFFSRSFLSTAERAIEEFAPELLIAAFPYQSLMLVRLARRHGIPLLYDAHNIEALRFRRMKRLVAAALIGPFERYMINNAAAVICVSEEEAGYIDSRFAAPTVLLPNGVNLPEHPASAEREFTYCFFGALDYAPNLGALKQLRNDWQIISGSMPEASLLLIGRSPPDWCRGMVGWHVAGEVDDVARSISRARILLCPICEGGGSRLKIIEAIANGLLVVSTRFGAEGFTQLADSGSVVICDIEDFAGTAISAAGQPIDHAAIAESARPWGWSVLVRSLESLDVFDTEPANS